MSISQKTNRKNENGSQALYIKAVTWTKDSHGLFDYQSKNCFHHKFKVKPSEILIFRNKITSEVRIAESNQEKAEFSSSEDNILLAEVRQKKDKDSVRYYINNPHENNSHKDSQKLRTEESLNADVTQNDVYLIVRGLKNSDGTNKGHPISIGEKIKLGRVEYSVIQMKSGSVVQVSDGNMQSFFKNNSQFEDLDIEIEKGSICKICIEQHETPDNFLLAPCKCIGSCQYVHINCLRRWIQSKVIKQIVGGTAHYNFQKFQCQICKVQLPKYIVKNGIHELLKIERPKQDYLILEEIGENKRDLIVIQNLPQQGIKLGRGHNCEIRVSDISVSRLHAMIKLIDGQFMIFDHNSKFGTLIKLNKNIPLNADKQAFQIGRTVLTFVLRKQKPEKQPAQIEFALVK